MTWQVNLGLTRRFMLFFILSGIIPVLLVSLFLIRDVHVRLESRLNSLLRTGQQLALSILQNDQEKLTLTAQQSAISSINDAFSAYLKTRKTDNLVKVAKQLAAVKELEFVVLADEQGRILGSYGIDPWYIGLTQRTFRPYLNSKGVMFGIEEFSSSARRQNRLYYVSAAPITLNTGKKQGMLLVGQYISSHFSFHKLDRILPLLKIQVHQRSEQKVIFQDKGLKQTTDLRSFIVPLMNNKNEVVGNIIVSTPVENEQKLYQHELLVTLLYLFIGIAFLIWLGLWLNRSIVKPLQSLANASISVAGGDFKVRIPDIATDREMQGTIRNFNQMVKQLEENDRLRNTFIASLTHDLRTPLLAERRVLELFGEFESELPRNFVKLTKGLSQSNEHLITMVNQMLEAYQLEAGKVHLACIRFSMRQAVAECIEKLMPLAQLHKITLINEVDENISELIADYHLFKRVIINLLGNAIDNLEEGNQVQMVATDLPDYLVLKVQDNGPGISEESIPDLFERFTTGQINRQKIASGLGLYICKIIMDAHEGSISVDSKIRQGTTFQLVFPKGNTPMDTPTGAVISDTGIPTI